jgi:crossover junction endodeoxyribonuclease RuvC
MRILGVDPGSVVCGYGLVEGQPGQPSYIACGTIRTASLERGPARLRMIHEELLRIIDEHLPTVLALERHFIAANVQSAFRLGEARAMALLAAAERDLDLFEYPPNEVKLAVAGHGHADKEQVKFTVRRTLELDPERALADDAADALAIAICHLGRSRTATLVNGVVRNRPTAPRVPR